MNRGPQTKQLTHSCSVLQKTIIYETQSGLNRHWRSYHGASKKNTDLNVNSAEDAVIPHTEENGKTESEMGNSGDGDRSDGQLTVTKNAKLKPCCCRTCGELVYSHERRTHKCYVDNLSMKNRVQLTHGCSVLKTTIKYETQGGLNKHMKKYHNKKENIRERTTSTVMEKYHNKKENIRERITSTVKVKNTVMESEHNCTVLQKIMRFATREAFEKHMANHHEENDVDGKVYLQEDGSLAVLKDYTESMLAGPQVLQLEADKVLPIEMDNVTNTSANFENQEQAADDYDDFQVTTVSKTKNKSSQQIRALTRLKELKLRSKEFQTAKQLSKGYQTSKQHSKVASKLVAKASKHINAAGKTASITKLSKYANINRSVNNVKGSCHANAIFESANTVKAKKLTHARLIALAKSSKKYKCNLCHASYSDAQTLVKHTQKWHFTKYISRVCKSCIKWFRYYAVYKNHDCLLYNSDRSEDGCWKVCHECNEFFENLRQAREHISAQGTVCKFGRTIEIGSPETVSGEDEKPKDEKFILLDDNINDESPEKNESKNKSGVQVEYVYKEHVQGMYKDNPDYKDHWMLS